MKAPISHSLLNFRLTFRDTSVEFVFSSVEYLFTSVEYLFMSVEYVFTSVEYLLASRSSFHSSLHASRWGRTLVFAIRKLHGVAQRTQAAYPSTSVDCQAARRGVPCPETHTQGVILGLGRIALHRETAIG